MYTNKIRNWFMCLGRQPNISSKLETLESQWYSSGPKVDRFKIQEDPMFQFQFEGRKRPMSSSSKQAEEDMRGVKSHQNYSWKIKKMIFCQILLIAWIRWKKKNKRSSLLIVGWSAFLFSSVLWLNDGHPYQRGQSPFTQSTKSNVHLIQNHSHRHTRNNVWPNIWAPCGPDRLTQN